MGNIGFLTFGASMIWLANTVLERASGSRDRGIVMLALLPLCAAGAAVFLIPSLLTSKSVEYFPIGMLLAFCWLGTEASLRGLAATDRSRKNFAIGKLLATCAVMLTLLVYVFRNSGN